MKYEDSLLILFDGDCPICCRKISFLERRNKRNNLSFADIRTADLQQLEINIAFQTLEKRIHAVKGDGTVVSGMEAVRAAWQGIGLGWLAAPMGWPLLKPLFDRLYDWVAKNRLKISRFFP